MVPFAIWLWRSSNDLFFDSLQEIVAIFSHGSLYEPWSCGIVSARGKRLRRRFKFQPLARMLAQMLARMLGDVPQPEL